MNPSLIAAVLLPIALAIAAKGAQRRNDGLSPYDPAWKVVTGFGIADAAVALGMIAWYCRAETLALV